MTKEELAGKFRQIYGKNPRIFRAPGRLNLIGEHTDYNEGFVLPFAIDRQAMVAGAARTDTNINFRALEVEESFTFDLLAPPVRQRGNWTDYVEGIARRLQERFGLHRGADLVFSSTVPIAAGLSSSAALEISTGFALLALAGIEIDRRELAFAAREAEHEFAGVRTGLMDQFASVFCKKDHALLLDCRSLGFRHIPLNVGDAIVVCDTGIKHDLAFSEYNTRRMECEKAVEILREKLPGIESLRDVDSSDFEKFQSVLPEKLKRRCRHVISENARTLAAAAALENSNLLEFGQSMFLSHESLRDDYEVSCPELDLLVETARHAGGVHGARMTGGGFGGCTVNLLESAVFEEFSGLIRQKYSEKFGVEPGIYPIRSGEGASEIV